MRFGIALGILVLAASPAAAGWQWTEWGMTWPELKAAMPIEFDPARDVRHQGGGAGFTVTFGTMENGLDKVTLYADPGTDCDGLKANLVSAYGAGDDLGHGETSWRDEEQGNRITFSVVRSRSICQIVYAPLIAKTAAGL